MYLVPHMTAQKAELINRRAALVVLGLCFVAGHAGGLGITPLAAIAGIFGLVTHDMSAAKRKLSHIFQAQWVLAMSLFVGWAVISSLWSPYDALEIRIIGAINPAAAIARGRPPCANLMAS